MVKHFDTRFKVKIDKEKNSVSLSIRVNDDVVNVYKSTLNEFNIMIAQYQSQLYDSYQDSTMYIEPTEEGETEN
jgi:hypothetical protein